MHIQSGMGNKVIVLTGAGICGGLWDNYRIEDTVSPYAYCKEHYQSVLSAQPNAAHTALVLLENELKDDFLLVTQNIDDLHQRAGNTRILPIHGEITKARCTKCGHIFENFDYSDENPFCPSCNTNTKVRPNIVWLGESPLFMDEIQEALAACKLFISIGTSGTVYPAAQFVDIARSSGAQTILLNTEPPENSLNFDHHIYGKESDTVIRLVNSIITGVDRQ
jgi:NAD-dependent deacetylase